MTEEEKREYAERLIRLFGQQTEFYTVFELYEGEGGEISDGDANDVMDLTHRAKVSVSWDA
jgi:hypothetical protein